MENTVRATSSMCAICFDVLIAKLKNENIDPIVQRFCKTEAQSERCSPLFVTWKIGEDKDLRGCIGTFDQTGKLGKTIPKYSLISAMNDSRFSPITLREVQHLTVCVSLLTNFTEIADPFAWEIGRHGIEIAFKVAGRSYSGTFLPEVAEEQGWDQATTLVQLFRKAGYKPSNSNRPHVDIVNDLRNNLSVTTYESSKTELDHAGYLRYLQENNLS